MVSRAWATDEACGSIMPTKVCEFNTRMSPPVPPLCLQRDHSLLECATFVSESRAAAAVWGLVYLTSGATHVPLVMATCMATCAHGHINSELTDAVAWRAGQASLHVPVPLRYIDIVVSNNMCGQFLVCLMARCDVVMTGTCTLPSLCPRKLSCTL